MGTSSPAPVRAKAASATSKRGRTSLSPVALAQAVIQAASAVPGVASVRSRGAGLAATYGPHARVAGVAIAHPTPNQLAIELHIIVSLADISPPASGSAQGAAAQGGQDMPVLLDIASQVRGAVYKAMRRHGERPITVDVCIDDLQ
ncbi:MAG: hypothetical protein OJF49_003407 [Ktedonobacterales bacterium]|nr:MAG: hypothetical protein OJF49_003407 [Ktedonobacterales bacterium]